jgi:hypothetical protein
MGLIGRFAAHIRNRIAPATIAREVGQTLREQAALGAAELRHNLQAFPQQQMQPIQPMRTPESLARSTPPQQARGLER